MDLHQALIKLGIALALGLLVGLQRERAASRVAGVRTFPLITLFGAVAALGAPALGAWVVPAGLLALTALLVMSNVAKLRQGEVDPGLTTEVAALLMYAVGAYVVAGHTAAAVAVGGAVVLLLHLKQPLHRVVRAMGDHDVTAIMQFALITFVILPVLPDKTYGPYGVLNPHRIWWMVVLIVAISLGGYVAYKIFGARAGALLGGVLGGLISSTATTVSFARRTREEVAAESAEKEGGQGARAGAKLATLVIVIASAVSFGRVIVEVAVVAPGQFRAMVAPLGAMTAWMAILAAAAYMLGRGERAGKLPEAKNPAELKPALIFGGLYALVILAVAFVKDRFGNAGLYPVAVVSGLTDMDAITLSTANLAHDGRLDVALAWRLILVAGLANMVFKGGCAMVLGSAGLRGQIVVYFGLALAGGVTILMLWP
ncbi:MAG TPA: MgtC/SapB family protein [Tepidisphaeraceae bacterium]|nr:MgtC/SapB family protein [Tepidisphaeraceae bacterium]